ncbi:MAG: reverse transcriptase domain-containing protein [Candidatus Pacearchaeota archaeon]
MVDTHINLKTGNRGKRGRAAPKSSSKKPKIGSPNPDIISETISQGSPLPSLGSPLPSQGSPLPSKVSEDVEQSDAEVPTLMEEGQMNSGVRPATNATLRIPKSKRVTCSKYTSFENSKNGNCFWEAVAMWKLRVKSPTPQVKALAKKLRVTTCDFAVNSKEVIISPYSRRGMEEDEYTLYQYYLANKPVDWMGTYEEYWAKQRKEGEYTNNPEMLTNAYRMGVNIWIWKKTENNKIYLHTTLEPLTTKTPKRLHLLLEEGSIQSEGHLKWIIRKESVEKAAETSNTMEQRGSLLVNTSKKKARKNKWISDSVQLLGKWNLASEQERQDIIGKFVKSNPNGTVCSLEDNESTFIPNIAEVDAAKLATKKGRLLGKCLRDGNIKKAIRLIESDGIANLHEEETMIKLESKFPAWVREGSTTTPISLRIFFEDDDEVARYFLSKKNGGAKCFWGTSTDNFKLLIQNHPEVIPVLRAILNYIASGVLDTSTRKSLLLGRGIALRKGDKGVRPIVIQHPLINAASVLMLLRYGGQITEICGSTQLGNKVSGGAEKVVHTIRALLTENENFGLIKVDSENAFNSIYPEVIINNLEKLIPEMLEFGKFILEEKEIFFQDRNLNKKIRMTRGTPQGCAISPLLFNLGQSTAISKIHIPGVTILSFQDDHFIMGEIDDIIKAFRTLTDELNRIGLCVNSTKSEIYFPREIPHHHNMIISNSKLKVVKDGLIILGSPIGDDIYCKNILKTKVSVIKQKLDSLHDSFNFPVVNPKTRVQTLFYIIRTCIPQMFNYFLRTNSPRISQEAAKLLDENVYELILKETDSNQFLLKASDKEKSNNMKRMFLQIKKGGFGISSSFHNAVFGYIGSFCLCAHDVYTTNSLTSNTWLKDYEISLTEIRNWKITIEDIESKDIILASKTKIQHVLLESFNTLRQEELLMDLPSVDPKHGKSCYYSIQDMETVVLRSQVRANQDTVASSWLLAHPGLPSNKINDSAFKIAVWIRCLFKILDNKICKCGKVFDRFGAHASVCENRKIRSSVTNNSHARLKHSLKEIYQINLSKSASLTG